MVTRQLIAYGILVLILLFLAAVLFRVSRRWRSDRRASLAYERLQRDRRREAKAGDAA